MPSGLTGSFGPRTRSCAQSYPPIRPASEAIPIGMLSPGPGITPIAHESRPGPTVGARLAFE
jgi:hypothetical protein